MPKQSRFRNTIKRAGDAKTLSQLLNVSGYRTVLMRDVLAEAKVRLLKAGRLNPGQEAIIGIQVQTIDNVMIACLGMPPDVQDKYRKQRTKDEFDKEVESMMDKISPVIIIPTGTVIGKPGSGKRFIH